MVIDDFYRSQARTSRGDWNDRSIPSLGKHLRASVAGCKIVYVAVACGSNRRHIPLTGVRVSLELNPDGKPATGSDIRRTIHLNGELSDDQQQQLLKAANACPMHKLLTGEIRIHTGLQR